MTAEHRQQLEECRSTLERVCHEMHEEYTDALKVESEYYTGYNIASLQRAVEAVNGALA